MVIFQSVQLPEASRSYTFGSSLGSTSEFSKSWGHPRREVTEAQIADAITLHKGRGWLVRSCSTSAEDWVEWEWFGRIYYDDDGWWLWSKNMVSLHRKTGLYPDFQSSWRIWLGGVLGRAFSWPFRCFGRLSSAASFGRTARGQPWSDFPKLEMPMT